MFAPPAAATDVKATISVVGLFRAASGIGQGARDAALAIEALGLDVERVDVSGIFDQANLPPFGDTIDPAQSNLTGTTILHVNAPETDRTLLALRAFRPKKRHLIGHWVWETDHAPVSWARSARRLSDVWAPSEFAAEAIAKRIESPVRVVPYRVHPPEIASIRPSRQWKDDKRLRCLTLADGRSSLHRKNPAAAITAFRRAFPGNENASLIVKLRNLDADRQAANDLKSIAEGDQRIDFLEATLSEDKRWSLLAGCDVLLSLHRAEGFGLPIAEAMSLGKCVVATGWSGNMDFCSEDTTALVPYTLAPAVDPTNRYPMDDDAKWAEPDIAAAASLLRSLYDNERKRLTIAAAARDAILRHNQRASERLKAALAGG